MTNDIQDKILGGLWGAIIGDALGVPVEFVSRENVRKNPITGMRGYGTFNLPPGTGRMIPPFFCVPWKACWMALTLTE